MNKAFVCECGCMIFTMNEGFTEFTCSACSNRYKVQHTINKNLLIIQTELWLYRWNKEKGAYGHAEKIIREL